MKRDDLDPGRGVVWWTLASAIGWLALLFALLVLTPPAHSAAPDVLLIQHAEVGPIEQAGTVTAFRYLGSTMLVEWADTTTDGIFRNGFEGAD